MRELDLTPYIVRVPQPSKANPAVMELADVPFDATQSVVNVLFGQGVNGREILKRDALAKKIEGAAGRSVLLEEDEYQTVLQAFRAWPTFGRHDVEMIRRVEDAPVVAVRPAGKKR